MSNRNIIAGLDIGTAWVRLIVCEIKAGDTVPQILAMAKKPSRGLRRGYVVNLEEITNSIREVTIEAERGIKTKIRKVVLGMGGVSLDSRLAEGSIMISRSNTEINDNDINRAVDESESNLLEINNRRILHRIPISFKIDNEKVLGHPDGLRGSKLEVKTLFVTCLDQHLRDLVQVTEDAGLIVDDVVASPLAASLAVITKAQKTAGCAMANIGSQTTSVAIFEDGLPLSVQVFPLGSMDITNDIALGFRIPLEDAERVKRGEGEPIGTKKKLDEIIEARLSDIFEFIERHLKRLGIAGLLPAGIIITGGGSSVSNIEDLAKNYFKLPARIASSTMATNSKSQIRDTAWAVAYGLCVYDLEESANSTFSPKALRNMTSKIWGWIRELMP